VFYMCVGVSKMFSTKGVKEKWLDITIHKLEMHHFTMINCLI